MQYTQVKYLPLNNTIEIEEDNEKDVELSSPGIRGKMWISEFITNNCYQIKPLIILLITQINFKMNQNKRKRYLLLQL